MKSFQKSVTFLCLECQEFFESDQVGEFQLVPCPSCGIDYITIKEKQKLNLQFFEEFKLKWNQWK